MTTIQDVVNELENNRKDQEKYSYVASEERSNIVSAVQELNKTLTSSINGLTDGLKNITVKTGFKFKIPGLEALKSGITDNVIVKSIKNTINGIRDAFLAPFALVKETMTLVKDSFTTALKGFGSIILSPFKAIKNFFGNKDERDELGILKSIDKNTDALNKNFDRWIEIMANQELDKVEQDREANKRKDKDGKDQKSSMFDKLLGNKGKGMLKGLPEFGAGLVLVSGALWVASKAFASFGNISWSDVGKGLLVLGGFVALAKGLELLKGSLVKSALGFGVFAAATWGISKALAEFSDVDWSTIAKAVVVLGGITLAATAMGAAAIPMAIGAAGLTAIGGAVWVIGKGFQELGDTFNMFIDSIIRLSEVGFTGLAGVAGGLGLLAPALVAFGAGAGLSGFMSLFGSGSQLDNLAKLAEHGDGIGKAAGGLKKLAEALKELAKVPSNAMDAINDFPWLKATAFVAAGGSMQVSGAKVYAKSNDAPPSVEKTVTKAEAVKQIATKTPSDSTEWTPMSHKNPNYKGPQKVSVLGKGALTREQIREGIKDGSIKRSHGNKALKIIDMKEKTHKIAVAQAAMGEKGPVKATIQGGKITEVKTLPEPVNINTTTQGSLFNLYPTHEEKSLQIVNNRDTRKADFMHARNIENQEMNKSSSPVLNNIMTGGSTTNNTSNTTVLNQGGTPNASDINDKPYFIW